MIHSHIVIDRIAELVKLAGLSNEDAIEEMTDHYLTKIEYAVAHGTKEQNAIRETYQHIANSDLGTIDQKRKKKSNWIVGSLVLTILLLSIVTLSLQKTKPVDITCNTSTSKVPDGWPILSDIERITSGFGLRINPISNIKRFHKGVDIIAKIGTPVLATGAGTVIESGYNHSSGHYILIYHNEYYSTRYLHLSEVKVTKGQRLEKSDIIGLVGNSGMSTSPHLHYEVIKNKKVVDPMQVIAP